MKRFFLTARSDLCAQPKPYGPCGVIPDLAVPSADLVFPIPVRNMALELQPTVHSPTQVLIPDAEPAGRHGFDTTFGIDIECLVVGRTADIVNLKFQERRACK